MLVEGLKEVGRVRAEDLLTAAASIAGERCIEAAGDLNPRKHQLAPGSRMFSDKINKLFCGDSLPVSLDTVPAESIVGVLRDKLLLTGYGEADFPSFEMLIEHFVANIGKKSDWGKVPLAVPEENQPSILPLQVVYETRAIVDRILQPLANPKEKLRAAVLALAESLEAVQGVIDKKIALLLALQMVNGMSKTAPMTDEAMQSLRKENSAQ
jgi:hypothetical protein